MKYTQEKLYDLPSQINTLRQLMISTSQVHGLASTETLRYSEELDKLIILVQLQNK